MTSEKTITVRKDHYCHICGARIPKGTQAIRKRDLYGMDRYEHPIGACVRYVHKGPGITKAEAIEAYANLADAMQKAGHR